MPRIKTAKKKKTRVIKRPPKKTGAAKKTQKATVTRKGKDTCRLQTSSKPSVGADKLGTPEIISDLDSSLGDVTPGGLAVADNIGGAKSVAEVFNPYAETTRDLRSISTDRRKAAYLETYLATGRNDLGCRAAGVGYQVPYMWARDDPDFEAAMNESRKIVNQMLEDVATKRGVEGVIKAIYQQGRLVGHERVFSDGLLSLLLKGNNPDKFDGNRKRGLERAKDQLTKGGGMSRKAANTIRGQFLGIKEK